MSEEQQISEAWETYSVIRDTGETPEETFKNGARGGIEIGRLAALRSMFVEVKPGEVSAGVDYWILRDGEWRDAWWFSDRLALGEAMNCERILKLNLPSPSDLFTEGVPR